MANLFTLFLRFRNFILFTILELICSRIIVKNNHYWEVSFFNTSNLLAGRIESKKNEISEYFKLKDRNEELVARNNALLKRVSDLEQMKSTYPNYKLDSTFAQRYQFISAKSINNSVGLVDNYITIDKGSKDGIVEGMGVVTASGVVGKVKSVNDHLSLVYSILHSKFRISGKLKNAQEIGTLSWDGINPKVALLNEISKYSKVKIGDSLITSDFNDFLPANHLIGRVKSISSDKSQAFHKIEISLTTNFSNIGYVFVVNNTQKGPQKLIEGELSQQFKEEQQ